MLQQSGLCAAAKQPLYILQTARQDFQSQHFKPQRSATVQSFSLALDHLQWQSESPNRPWRAYSSPTSPAAAALTNPGPVRQSAGPHMHVMAPVQCPPPLRQQQQCQGAKARRHCAHRLLQQETQPLTLDSCRTHPRQSKAPVAYEECGQRSTHAIIIIIIIIIRSLQ
jgi:hypothetical protein